MKQVWYIKLNKKLPDWDIKMIGKLSGCILWEIDEIPDNRVKKNLISKDEDILGQVAFLGWFEKDKDATTKG